MLDFDTYVATLRSHASLFADAITGVPADTPVPSCPDWSLSDLTRHLGTHHRWVLANIERAPDEGMAPFEGLEPPPDWEGAVGWLAAGAELLAIRLADFGPEKRCWTWAGEPVTGFWARRTAHETVAHSWDAGGATGRTVPLDPAVASDGIDEWLSLAGLLGRVRGGGETMHVHCTDVEGEWLVGLGTDGLTVTREHAKGDVAVRGGAGDLFLVLLGRKPPAAVEVLGDAAVLDAWLAAARF
jgi:uncharacterized protein (TIGR03083 family)